MKLLLKLNVIPVFVVTGMPLWVLQIHIELRKK